MLYLVCLLIYCASIHPIITQCTDTGSFEADMLKHVMFTAIWCHILIQQIAPPVIPVTLHRAIIIMILPRYQIIVDSNPSPIINGSPLTTQHFSNLHYLCTNVKNLWLMFPRLQMPMYKDVVNIFNEMNDINWNISQIELQSFVDMV